MGGVYTEYYGKIINILFLVKNSILKVKLESAKSQKLMFVKFFYNWIREILCPQKYPMMVNREIREN